MVEHSEREGGWKGEAGRLGSVSPVVLRRGMKDQRQRESEAHTARWGTVVRLQGDGTEGLGDHSLSKALAIQI